MRRAVRPSRAVPARWSGDRLLAWDRARLSSLQEGHAGGQTVAGWNSSVLPSGSLHSIWTRPPGCVFSHVLDALALERVHGVVVDHLEARVAAERADRRRRSG